MLLENSKLAVVHIWLALIEQYMQKVMGVWLLFEWLNWTNGWLPNIWPMYLHTQTYHHFCVNIYNSSAPTLLNYYGVNTHMYKVLLEANGGPVLSE